MKDTSRQPTSVARLAHLLEIRVQEGATEDDINNADQIEEDVSNWLQWTHNFLSARKLYHKKTALRSAILQKMAKTLLSKDELEAIDAEAEKQLGNLPDEDDVHADEIKPTHDPAYNREEIE